MVTRSILGRIRRRLSLDPARQVPCDTPSLVLRQGNVTLVPAHRITPGLHGMDVPAEGVTLMGPCHGRPRGSHRVTGTLDVWAPPGSRLPSFLLVDGTAVSSHEEHGPVTLTHGLWEVRRDAMAA